jgi:hypothetical protein
MQAVGRGKMSLHHIPFTFAPQELAPMHTTIPTNPSSSILAIDLGKYQSVAGLYGNDPQAAQFRQCTTDEAQLRRLFIRYRPQVVVIEACLLGRLDP